MAHGSGRESLGRLEIYGIPAYLPSTFLSTTVEDNIDYCALEVSIGVPRGKPRVHLIFRKQPKSELTREDGQDLFRRLEAIYRGILRERVPLLRLPGAMEVFPEADAELKSHYDELQKRLLHPATTISTTNLRENSDLYDGQARAFDGEAVCLGTLRLDRCFGFRDTFELAKKVQAEIEKSVWPGDSAQSKIRWIDADSFFLPVFWYKRSFYENFEASVSEKGKLFGEMRHVLENSRAFSVEFTRMTVDSGGIIYLAGFERSTPADRSKKPALTEIRDALDTICDLPYARYTPKRPLEILLPIGYLHNQTLTEDEADALKQFVERHSVLPKPSTPLLIDRLRMVKLSGGAPPVSIETVSGMERIYLAQGAEWLRYLAEGKTDKSSESSYGVLSPRKWLAHPRVVDCVKAKQFNRIIPITVQISPTLRCTNHCPICSYGGIKGPLLRRGRGKTQREVNPIKLHQQSTPVDMSLDDIIDTIDQLRHAGVRGVIFTGGGEPLMNGATLEGMLYARRNVRWKSRESRGAGKTHKKRLSVGLFTNGQLLDCDDGIEKIARDIDPSFVRVSLNAGNSTAYSLVHGTPLDETRITFEHVLGNIERLAKAKQDYDASFRLDIGVLISPLILDNLLDLSYELKRIAFRYPGMLNGVAIRPAVRYCSGCWNQPAVKRCARYLKNRGHAESFLAFINRGAQFPAAIFEEAKAIVDREVRPILAAGSHPIPVSLPTQRFDDLGNQASEMKLGRCIAAPLVAFVGPDTSLYHCVERALDPSLSYGKLSQIDCAPEGGLTALLAAGRSRCENRSCQDCPPVCLLHEYNDVFTTLANRLNGPEGERTRHDIDVAAEYFNDRVGTLLGQDVADFI